MTKANIFEAMFIVVAIAVVGAGSVGVTLLLTGDSDNSNSDSSQMQDAPSNQQPQIQKVALNTKDQSPLLIQAKQGDYIQFEPSDDSKHQIVSAGSGEHAEDGFDSGVFDSTESYRMQVKDLGTFELQDTFNPDQKITIQTN